MNVKSISFGNVYKINASNRDVFEVKNYLEKNQAKNKNGFEVKNADVRIFDDMKKDEPPFCFEKKDGDCFILTGREGNKAWEYTCEMMDNWVEAGRYYEVGEELDRMYDHYAKIANDKITELIDVSPSQEINVEWKKDKPIFSLVG